MPVYVVALAVARRRRGGTQPMLVAAPPLWRMIAEEAASAVRDLATSAAAVLRRITGRWRTRD